MKISSISQKRRVSGLISLLLAFAWIPTAQAQLNASSTVVSRPSHHFEACVEPDYPPHYIGFWREQAGTDEWAIFDTWEHLLEGHSLRGDSLIDIEAFGIPSGTGYAAVWQSGSGGEILTNHPDLAALEATKNSKEAEGYGLVEVEVLVEGADVQFLAVWRPGAPSVDLLQTSSSADLEDANLPAGKFVIDIETWKPSGTTRQFLGLLRPLIQNDSSQTIKMAQSWCVFHFQFHGLEETHRITDVEFYIDAQGNHRYAAVWSGGTGNDHLRIGYRYNDSLDANAINQEPPGLILRDLEIIDAGIGLTMNASLTTDPSERERYKVKKPKRQKSLKSRESKRSRRRSARSYALVDDFKENGEDPIVIVGAPPLHDTGSSGPD